MRKHAQLVRIKKLKGATIIEVAARHNLREIAAEIGGYGGIDGRRTAQNYILRGASTAVGVASEAQLLMDQDSIKHLRKDAVRGLEVIISLRPNSTIDGKPFFCDSLAWADSYFKAPVISAVVHCDEPTLHCHVLILPLVNGCMNGSRLMGNKAKLQSMQADFNRQVGERYGLTYQASGRRQGASVLPPACKDVLDAIKAHPERLNELALRDALLVAIDYNLEAILLELEKQTVNTKPIGFQSGTPQQQKANPIGFPHELDAGNNQSLSCVGFQFQRTNKRPYIRRKKGKAQAKAGQVLEQLLAGIRKQDVAHNLGIGIASVYRILAGAKNHV